MGIGLNRRAALAAALALALFGPALAAPADDPRDLSGMWLRTEGPYMDTARFMAAAKRIAAPGTVIPQTNPAEFPNRHPPLPLQYTPEFAAMQRKYAADLEAGNPYRTARHCLAAGTFQLMMSVPWLEIWKRDDRFMLKGFLVAQEYRIFTHRGLRDEYPVKPELFGDSVGRWEGDVLVVDTTNLGAHAVLMETEPVSQSLTIRQRIWKPTPDTLRVEMTLTDPRAWTQPAQFSAAWRRAERGAPGLNGLDEDLDPVESQCFDDGGGAEMGPAPE